MCKYVIESLWWQNFGLMAKDFANIYFYVKNQVQVSALLINYGIKTVCLLIRKIIVWIIHCHQNGWIRSQKSWKNIHGYSIQYF